MADDWKTYKLEELTNKLGDGLHGTPKYSNEGDYFFVNGNNLVDGKIQIKSDTKRVSYEEFQKHKKELNQRTLLISINGTIGNVAEYGFEKIILGKSACYFNVVEGVSKEFIKQVFSGKMTKQFLENNATGTTIKNVSLKTMREFLVKLPSLQEQHSIAQILSAIDDKIENNLAINQTLEEMAMALYKHWFVDFGPFQDGKFIESELGLIPEGWEVKRLDEICENIYSGGTPNTSEKHYWNGEIPWLSSGETRDKFIISADKTITKLGLEKSSSRMARKNDTVIASAGQGKTRGQTSFLFFDTSINQSVIVLRANGEFINKETLFLDLSSRYDEFRMISDSYSTRGSLTTKLIGSQIKLVLPKISVQDSFNDIIKDKFNVINVNLKENKLLTQLSDTLLPKLISGEIRVKEFRH